MQYTWNDIEQHINACTQCPLGRTRNLPVMGRGSHEADIMLIAEAPGAQEDQQGIPFVGRSGEILDRLFRDCGLSREEVYITNILKCHPPGNRDPREEEKEACFLYLKYETSHTLQSHAGFSDLISKKVIDINLTYAGYGALCIASSLPI